MRIYELLDELKEEIENSPKSIFSNKRSIDPEVIIEIICDIKTALPDEIKEAESLVKEKNRILKKANEEATAHCCQRGGRTENACVGRPCCSGSRNQSGGAAE